MIIEFCSQFANKFLAMLLSKINVLNILNIYDSFHIFVTSRNTEFSYRIKLLVVNSRAMDFYKYFELYYAMVLEKI